MKGIIISSVCGTYTIDANGQKYEVKPRGKFRHNGVKPCVGDYCEFDENALIIEKILERKNKLIRPAISNIDKAYIVMSKSEPEFSPLLISKFLTYLSSLSIKGSLIITKMDKSEDDNEILKWKSIYESQGIDVYLLSVHQDLDKEKLIQDLKGKTSVFIGQSGVGKSSLLNYIYPEWELKIGEYSYALGRGKHQTKEVILLPFMGGYIGDTPGFSSLDLNLTKDEIAEFFLGFNNFFGKCYFKDCTHTHEKNCLLKEALSLGNYPNELYEHYLLLLKEIEQNKRR